MRDQADCGEYRQAAGAFAEAVIRSMELIVELAASRRRGRSFPARDGDVLPAFRRRCSFAPLNKALIRHNWRRRSDRVSTCHAGSTEERKLERRKPFLSRRRYQLAASS